MPDKQYAVLLFAVLREAAKSDRIDLQVQSDAPLTVAELLRAIGEQCPPIARWLPHVRVAVNCAYVTSEQIIEPHDEIALIPPVAGGETILHDRHC